MGPQPEDLAKKKSTKLIAAISTLVTEAIPADPGAPKFRQGNTLGGDRKHWLRAKFFQQYRLFYRFDSSSKTIVLAWVNDRSCLHSRSSGTDAYATFRCMLDSGNPPEDFEDLMKEAADPAVRFKESLSASEF